MVKLKSKDEIDFVKLKELFKERGWGIITPGFSKYILSAFDDSSKEVHQCDCGELMFLHVKMANLLRETFKTENIPCKRCGDYSELMFDMRTFKLVQEITELICEISKMSTKDMCEKAIREKVEELKRKAGGWLACDSLDEIFFSHYNFIREFITALDIDRDTTGLEAVNKLIRDAEGKASKLTKAYEIMSEAGHIPLENAFSDMDLLERYTEHYHDVELFKPRIGEGTRNLTEERIRLMMSEYRNRVENDAFLDLLMNLITIVGSADPSPKPFKNKQLPPIKPGAKPRRIWGLADKIESFKYEKRGMEVYPILNKLYNTHLRNAISHNEYELRKENQEIELVRYGEHLKFDEFEGLVKELRKFQFFVETFIADIYINEKKCELKDCGIKAAILGYEDPILIGNDLFPRNMCLSELMICQFWDFETFNDGERYVPIPNFDINNGQKNLKISFGNRGNVFLYSLDSEDVQMWLDYVIYHGRLKISLKTIAPLLPQFLEKSEALLPIKNNHFYILSSHKKELKIDPFNLKKLARAISKR